MLAAQQGKLSLVKILIRAGAQINERASEEEFYGATALYFACQNGKIKVAKVLLKHNAKVDVALDQIGVTPLFIAAERGNVKLVELLLKYHADVHVRNWNGVTAFAMAILSGSKAKLEIYDMLLAAGAELETEDNEGVTPLHSAVANADQTLKVAYLLQHKSNPNHKNHAGVSVLQNALLGVKTFENRGWIVSALLEAGATVNADTLSTAVRSGVNEHIVSLLFEETTHNVR